jgi:fructose-1,6-bisphosphatase/inositol monophosphatase family enzyme
MIEGADQLLSLIQRLHAHIRDTVVATCERSAVEDMSRVDAEDAAGDTIYAIDRVSEELLVSFFAREVAPRWPLLLVAEGLPGGQVCLPEGCRAEDAAIRVLMDPIDGTRGLMYQKRSAWILTGIAPNRGPATSLRDIELAVQTEIPLVKQHLSDMLWATPGGSVQVVRHNRLTGEQQPVVLRPSRASSIAHGFAMISRFFPGARQELAAIDEAVILSVLGPPQPGRAHCFEDQYISSAGQLYELIAGHDRFVADLRPLLDHWLAARGQALGICCHPYDMATMLIAERAGVIVTNEAGAPLDAPFSTEHEVSWAGYANAAIRAQVEPVLLAELRQRGLLDDL